MDKTATGIEEKVTHLLDEAYALRVHSLARSVELAGKALELSRASNEPSLIAKSLNQLSLFYMIRGEYEEAIGLAEEAIKYFEELGDDRGIADAKYNIAGTLYKTDSFNLGLVHLIDCQKIYRKYDDQHNLARVQKSIGTIYEYFGDQKSAIKSYEEAIDSGVKANNLNLQSNAFNPLSGIYLNQGKVEKAMTLIEQAIAMKSQTGDTRGLAFSLYGRGKVYTQTGEYKKAEDDFLESNRIHEEMGEKLGLGMGYHKLGALFIESGEYEKAKDYLFKALDFSKSYKVAIIVFKAYYLLYTVFKKENNIEVALEYLEKFIDAKALVINEQTAKLIEGYDEISQMHSMELEAQSQKEKMNIIERKNQELDSFFHRVSHDLKGPITSLISLDAIIRDEVKDAGVLRFMDMGVDQVYRMNHILDELINLTRITHEDEAIQDINFEEIVKECLGSLKALPHFNQVAFESQVQPDMNFKAPWALINTIIQNLIENGIKYARVDQSNPFVKVNISKNDHEIIIVVDDNGVGMSKDTGKNIFEMFYRANKQVVGSGLGLYILNRAVEKLQGTVALDSEIERGSTFTITLPCG